MGRRKKFLNKKTQEAIIAIVIIILFIIADQIGILKTEKENIEIPTSVSENITIDNNKLNILFFDVGQADCELIICNGKTLLIDSGNSKDGENIVNAIKELGITKLDYVVGTHVHEDHTGGMSYIVDNFEIGTFYLPYNTTSTTNFYKRLLTSLTNKNLSITEANIGDKFEVGESSCEIMFVDNTEPENINEESIVIELSYKNQKYLFMGDAEKNNELSRKWNDVDVLKVGHHGSNTSTSEEFLKQTLPEIAIISVGRNNSYGLPKDTILERLELIGSTIYRTDTDGTIQLLSDGENNEIIKINLCLDGN